MADLVTVESLFEAIGYAGRDLAKAIRENDSDLGVGASSALANALGMLPQELRDDLVAALTDRDLLAAPLRALAL
jgi:hypothetical protein